MSEQPTIAVDFDDVLHLDIEQDGDTPTGPPVMGSLGFIEDLQLMGYKVIIFSHRAHTQAGKQGIRDWLSQHGFPRLPVTNEKPPAIGYVDDRAIRFEGDFNEMMKFIRSPKAEPWTTRDG